MNGTRQFDVIVIGGGSGLTVAACALQEQRSVALVTDRPHALGGTCVNFGCIPTKTLIQAADTIRAVRTARDFGIHLDSASVNADFTGIMQGMRRARAANASDVAQWVNDAMTPIYSHVHFVGDKLLETEDGKRITADKLFIAAGARAAVPPISGLDETGYWTNESVLELDRQPASLAIIGGGYIAAELGYFFAAMGTDVTVINDSPLMLAEDFEVRELFTRQFTRQVKLVIGTAVRTRRVGAEKEVTVHDGEGGTTTIRAERLLLAAGRQPNTDALCLSETGVGIDEKGAVQVDETLQTAHPDVYAYGDVIGKAMFKHTSSYEGELAWRNAQGGNETVDYLANPHAIFSHPRIGSVGLREDECQAQKLDYVAARVDYADVAKGKILESPPGFAKLLVERKSHRILGFHVIGPYADLLIPEVVVAMNVGGCSADYVRTSIHTHPSLAELVGRVFDKARTAP